MLVEQAMMPITKLLKFITTRKLTFSQSSPNLTTSGDDSLESADLISACGRSINTAKVKACFS